GFALSYSHTKKKDYLDVARRLAARFIEQLGAGVAPAWDFRLPPGAPRLLDSSAAAIAVCGLQELLKHQPGDKSLMAAKNQMLNGLCSGEFLDFDESVPGILKLAQA